MIDNHYNFDVYVPAEDGKTYGIIRVDPYLVAKLWGITDPSHFHILKTICRYGRKPGNTKERENAALFSALERGLQADKTLALSENLREDSQCKSNQ